jgi:hypothetical protein
LERETLPGEVTSAGEIQGDLAVFESEAQWRASHLLARVRGEPSGAWFFAPLEAEGPPLEALARDGRRQLAWEVLRRLSAKGVLTEVIHGLPLSGLVDLARVLGVDSILPGQEEPDRFKPDQQRAPLGPVAARVLELVGGLRPDLPQEVLALAVQAHSLRLLGPEAANRRLGAVIGAVMGRLQESRSREPQTPGAGLPSVIGRAQEPQPEAPVPFPRADVADVPVRFGGLFYLLNCALELGVGEVLWQACLPESRVLAAGVAAWLASAGGDAETVRLFAGAAAASQFTVEQAQQEEVAGALLAGLGSALPRRSLAELPRVGLGLASHQAGRLLIAAPLGSAFPIFAWPAGGPDAVHQGLAAFLGGWTAAAPRPLAPPWLAELDSTGRIGPSPEPQLAPALLLPVAATPWEAALVAQTVGVLGALFEARALAWPAVSPRALVEDFFLFPARVRLEPEQLTVFIPAAQVNLLVRRAGLDKDPGWVPWLGRQVFFAFD